MKRNSKKLERKVSLSGRVRRPPARLASILAVVLVAGCALGLVVRAYSRRSVEPTVSSTPSPPAMTQTARPWASDLLSRLRLQPEADKLRRRLGQRFTSSSLGVSVFLGTLTIGNTPQPIRITRSQDGDGEQVAITIGGEPTTLSWNSGGGPKAGTHPATPSQRTIIERLALDSPDQFIFAQLRGAAYNTIARNVRPAEAAGSDDYDGPVWDMVRVVESTSESSIQPQSPSRIYYLNSSTGLIDKILSQEEGENVIAQITSWANQGGELLFTRIIWSRDKQVLMELSLNSASLGAR